jgi:hypothetical protein
LAYKHLKVRGPPPAVKRAARRGRPPACRRHSIGDPDRAVILIDRVS